MKKLFLLLAFPMVVIAASAPVRYVQVDPPATQQGGSNTQTARVTNTLTIPYVGSGTQCLRSVNGVISGTGQDCGASVITGSSNTIVASPQFQIPFYSGSGSTNTLTGASGFSWYGSSAQVTGVLVSSGALNINSVNGVGGPINFLGPDNNPLAGLVGIGLDPFGSGAFYIGSGAGVGINTNDNRHIADLIVRRGGGGSSAYSTFVLTDNGSGTGHYSGLSSTSGITTDTVWSLPVRDGTTAQALLTNGTGNLYFGTPPGALGGIVSPGTFTWQNNFGIGATTGVYTSTLSAKSLNIGNTTPGHNLIPVNFIDVGSNVANMTYDNAIGFTWTPGTTASFAQALTLSKDTGGLTEGFGITGGSLTLRNVASGTQCLHTDSSGHVTGTGSDCGSSGSGVTVYPATATVTFPFGVNASSSMVILNTSIPPNYYSTIENPLVYISQQSAIGLNVGAQTDGLFVDFLDTGAVTNPLNDGVGIHGRSRQFQGSNGQLIAGLFDTQSQGANGPPSIAMQLVPGWVSDLAGGTNELIEGLVINPRIATITGGTLLSTGTAIGIRIPDFTNGKGAAGKNWPLYIDNPYPSYFLGSMGINQTDPQAPLSIASNGASQYALIVGTQTSGSTTMVSSQYLMTVSTQGAVTVNSLALNGTGNPSFTKNGDVNTYQIAGSSTVATAGQCAAWTSSDTLQGITCASGGGGTPASPVGAIQYNSAGSFAAVSGSFVTASSVTLPITMVRSSMTIDNGSAAQDNSSPGFLDVFQQAPVTSGILMSVGSSNQANQFVIQDQQPIKFQTNGIQAGFLNIGQSASEKISAGALSANQFINFDNSGEMDIQTASVGSGGKDIVMLPYQVETFRVSSASNTSAVPLLVSAAQGGLYLSNGQTGANSASGINLQTTPVSGANFAGGLLGYNLSWNVNSSSYIVSNDFGTDYFGMMVRRGGDVAFTGSNNTAANTFLTDAQVMANNKLYIKGTTGLLGVNMGATVPSTSGFQVQGSTTVPYLAYLSTTTSGGFGVDVSTTGHFNIFNSSATQGPTITNGTGDASCSDAACTITASNSPVTFTFAKPYTKVPVCVVTEQTDSVVNALSYSKTATALTITQTGLGGALLDVICVGRD